MSWIIFEIFDRLFNLKSCLLDWFTHLVGYCLCKFFFTFLKNLSHSTNYFSSFFESSILLNFETFFSIFYFFLDLIFWCYFEFLSYFSCIWIFWFDNLWHLTLIFLLEKTGVFFRLIDYLMNKDIFFIKFWYKIIIFTELLNFN